MAARVGDAVLCLLLAGVISAVESHSSDRGFTFGSLETRRRELDIWENAMYIPEPDKPIGMNGPVMHWSFYANHRGPIYLQVWRAVPGNANKFELVGQEFYEVKQTGLHVIHPEETNSIEVKEGDVGGFYFPGKSIVPFDIKANCDLSKRGLYVRSPPQGVVSPGKVYQFSRMESGWRPCRVYSFSTTIGGHGFAELGRQTVNRPYLDRWSDAIMIPEPHQTLKNGVLFGFRFYARRTGSFAIQVWRPTGSDSEYELVGEAKGRVSKIGITYIHPQNPRLIETKDGDVVGFYFPGNSIIPFDGRECTDERGLYVKSPPRDQIKIGGKFRFKAKQRGWKPCRKYSISYSTIRGSWKGHEPTPRKAVDEWSNAMYIPNPDQPIQKTGQINGWRFFATKKNPIYLQVFRPVFGIDNYRLVGQTRAYLYGTGLMHKGANGIKVQKGDVLGFYFPAGSVVPFDGTECFSMSKRGLYVRNPKNVQVGESFRFSRNRMGWKPCREYSFGALIESAKRKKRSTEKKKESLHHLVSKMIN